MYSQENLACSAFREGFTCLGPDSAICWASLVSNKPWIISTANFVFFSFSLLEFYLVQNHQNLARCCSGSCLFSHWLPSDCSNHPPSLPFHLLLVPSWALSKGRAFSSDLILFHTRELHLTWQVLGIQPGQEVPGMDAGYAGSPRRAVVQLKEPQHSCITINTPSCLFETLSPWLPP